MKPTDARKRDDLACSLRLDVARDRRVAAKRHMRSIAVVVSDVLANEPKQMPLSEHDDVVEQLATQSPNPSLGESVLPGRARRDPNLLDAEAVDARVKRGAVDGVAVADQAGHAIVDADGLDDLLSGPCGARMRRHVDVEQSTAFKREDEKDVKNAKGHGRHGQEVDRDRASEMVATKVFQVCDGGGGGRRVGLGMYLAAVSLETR